MHARIMALCLAALVMGIMACGSGSMVVLVPDRDGSVGEITVSNAAGTVAIDEANHATVVRDRNTAPAPAAEKSPAEIDRLFGPVIEHQPLAPVHFILYFESASDVLLPDSRGQLPDIKAAIDARAPTRVSVVGHSDTQGDEQYNLKLSLSRAQAVAAWLIRSGVDEGAIDITSHGEKNPLVKTADNVANARNRRVEVIVR
jgi:outer membrane protein OmpA-like peptidoglycan-associated protein